MDKEGMKALYAEGYCSLREIDGTLCGVMRMLFTTGLFVGLSATAWERRYCYEQFDDAVEALHHWDGKGDPPGPWIKEKPGDRLGPGVVEEAT